MFIKTYPRHPKSPQIELFSTFQSILDYSNNDFFSSKGDVTVQYIRGLPHVIVPLPSRAEKCQFALRPITHNVGDFLQMLRAEDNGIDRAIILNGDGIRIAAASTIESLLDSSFWYVAFFSHKY